MKVRLHFHIKQLHQLVVDTADYPTAPQDDADEFADWVETAGWRVHDELIGRTDSFRSWVDTEDEIEVQSGDEEASE